MLSAVTDWVAEITSCPLATYHIYQCIINSSAPHKSSLHKLHKKYNKKMVKSCAAIGCKKEDTVVEKAFIDFLVVKSDKNSG